MATTQRGHGVDRSGSAIGIDGVRDVRSGIGRDGRGGFELPTDAALQPRPTREEQLR